MSDLQDNYTIAEFNAGYDIFGAKHGSMTFTATNGYALEQVAFRMDRTGSPGTCQIDIYATDPITGFPTGSSLSSQSFDGDLVSTATTFYPVTFTSSYALTRGTQYAIALSCPAGDFSNKLELVQRTEATSDYSSGIAGVSTDSGANWGSIAAGGVFTFQIYGTLSDPTLLTDLVLDRDSEASGSVNTVRWVAQTFVPGADGSIVGLDLSVYADQFDAGSSTITVEIFPTDESGTPVTSGSALGTATYQRDNLANISNRPLPWFPVNFTPPVAVSGGVEYAIIVRQSNALNTPLSFNTGEGLYPAGTMWETDNAGSSWGLHGGGEDSFALKIYVFSTVAVTPTDIDYSKKLVAVGNNEMWYEATPGTMAELPAATGDIDCGDLLNIFEGYGKVFVTNKDKLKVADFQNSKITTANVGVYPQFGAYIIGGTSGAAMSVDYITSLSGACTIYGTNVTAATFTNGEAITGTNPDGTSVSFTTNSAEVASPHWYDWTTYGNSTNFGALPPRATLGCLFRGRAVISGNNIAPHQWYMSRQANPFDWLYGINDAQSAVAGNNTDAGEVGDVVTALIPYKDDYLIFGCVDSMWYLTGDPASGGSLDELDLTTGVFGANSWCWGEDDVLYFWGLNGVYKVTLPGGAPKCISEIRLPALVGEEGADPSTHRITMAYDKRRAGILITIVKLADGSNSCYWYDFRTEGFFPEEYPVSNGVFSSVQYNAFDADYKQVMYGCTDGYIRFHDDATKDDEITSQAQAIESYVTFGPFLMAKWAGDEGKITGFDLILGGGGAAPQSDGASYEFYTGKSAQEVAKKMAAGTPIAAAGSQLGSGRSRKTFKKKVRGVYCGIKVKNITLAQTWAMEQALIAIAKGGRLR
jgi:hypothetical protein